MIKISYPADRTKFEKGYYQSLDLSNEAEINKHLKNILFQGDSLTFERLVSCSIEDLLSLESDLKNYSDKVSDITKNEKGKEIRICDFDNLFDYSTNQPSISSFFMNSPELDLKICNYCGIEYINAFVDIEDYNSVESFLNTAGMKDLKRIVGIGDVTAQKIIDARAKKPLKTSKDVEDLTKPVREAIDALDFKNTHNHFTLDHVIPQSTHKFFSLCLYNFVPSCSSCNSKFKGATEFKINADLSKVVPTSEKFTLNNDFKFKINYSKSSLGDIKSVNDFVLVKEIGVNEDHIHDYLRMFKLMGRYTYHKDQALKLIDKRVNYPDSMIREISKITGFSVNKLKDMIFGEEVFDQGNNSEPMAKFKRDIALSIGLKK